MPLTLNKHHSLSTKRKSQVSSSHFRGIHVLSFMCALYRLYCETKQLTLKECPPSFLRWNIKPAKQNRSLCGLNVFHYNLTRTWSMIPSSLNVAKDECSALWILRRVRQQSLRRTARIVYDEEGDIRPLNTFHLMAEEVFWLQDRLRFFLDLIHCKSHWMKSPVFVKLLKQLSAHEPLLL